MDREPRREVLAGLYARHYAQLVRVAFALTGDWALAEDLAQEAFVRAWRSWGRLRREEAARAYLHAIVVNLARTSLRRQAREVRARAAASWIGANIGVEAPAGDGIDLLRALARLPVRKRACVVLRFYADLSEADTAAALGISVGTVKSQTARALRMLQQLLAEADSVSCVTPASQEAADGA
jgi:RNA polymerase sigma-70 factor (sigma-E family)